MLSLDPQTAREEMEGLIFYLATYGYIDGDFDPSELAFVEATMSKIIDAHVHDISDGRDPEGEKALREEFYSQFRSAFDAAQHEVARLLCESVVEAESKRAFFLCRLKLRCFEIFQSFSPTRQRMLLEAGDQLLRADERVHAAELKFSHELLDLLDERVEIEEPALGVAHPPSFHTDEHLHHTPQAHPGLAQLEAPFSPDAGVRAEQIARDERLIRSVELLLEEQRQQGNGRLKGKTQVDELLNDPPFLDGHVYVLPPMERKEYDITVIGDLHGCYSCLKGAVIQSGFFEKIAKYQEDPFHHPDPKLVLLGDYIDRGRFGFDGVMRAALHLLVSAPKHVYMLRGNHEYWVEQEGRIVSTVSPAESIVALRELTPQDFQKRYVNLFQSLPNLLLFGRILLAHGGIPRDVSIRSFVKDLSGLNHESVRFEMMWSDPSIADVIPRALQEATHRFGFGRLQALSFLRQLGCHTLIRGHDRVKSGIQILPCGGEGRIVTVFSAGGSSNLDLPPSSDYRGTRPMALTLRTSGGIDGETRVTAWPIDYKPYNTPEYNLFYL